jgi:multicomponent Na+:H+ antiporter subunit D
MHIFNHALMKGVAFLCVGAMIYRIGTRQLSDMYGIARRMPVTATALAISLFALIGMPPLNGFMSELTIVTAAFQSDLAWLGISVIINSVLSAAYYLRVVGAMFRPAASAAVEGAREAPWVMLVPICVLVSMIIIFGLWPDPLMNLMRQSAACLTTLLSQGGV